MRIRTIKPEFFTHEGLFEAENESKLPLRLAFIGLWCAADREGRFRWEPRRLGVQIMPYDKTDFSRVLDALTTRGFIRHYACRTGDFGVIPSFLRHQVINNRERPSELPDPATMAECDTCPTREGRVPHAGKAEGKGREGNKEGNSSVADASSRHSQITSQIGQVYQDATGEAFAFTGQFAAALKGFLAGWPADQTADQFLDRYYDVLQLRDAPFASLVKRAADPVFLCKNWMSVEAELSGLSRKPTPRPAFKNSI